MKLINQLNYVNKRNKNKINNITNNTIDNSIQLAGNTSLSKMS